MKPSAQPIDEALLDVRKAYRLIHDYQRMTLDVVKYIGQQLGMTYAGGSPKFSDASPRPGKGSLDFWAWDWLNLVLYEFRFTQGSAKGRGVTLSILLISDTGYFSSGEEPREEPDGSSFPSVTSSRTAVAFLLSKKPWTPSFMESNQGLKRFIDSGGRLFAPDRAKGRVALFCDYARLVTESETNAMIDELVVLAAKSGLPLQPAVHRITETQAKAPSKLNGRFGGVDHIPNTDIMHTAIPRGFLGWDKFALTFNGYLVHGGFSRCAKIANRRDPKTLTDYRTCLFFEQRRWRNFERTPDAKGKAYIRSLLAGIRKKVALGNLE